MPRVFCANLKRMSELNSAQLKQLAEFTSNLSLILLGSAVIAPIFANSPKIDPFVTAYSIVLSTALVILSIWILKGVKQNDK